MATTYEPIATTTLASNANTVTFSSISQAYTDLVLVMRFSYASGTSSGIRFNGDSGASSYAWTYMYGQNGSKAGGNITSDTLGVGYVPTAGNPAIVISNILGYTSSKGKGVLTKNSDPGNRVQYDYGLWNNSTAINRIDIIVASSGNFASGSVFTIYGIKAA